MKNKFLVPLAVLGLVMLTQLACLDTNYYDGAQPPSTSKAPSAVGADDGIGGEYAMVALVMAIYVTVGGSCYLSKMGTSSSTLHGAIYWLLQVGGLFAFGYGVLVFTVGSIPLIAVGGAGILLAAPWAIWGDRLV